MENIKDLTEKTNVEPRNSTKEVTRRILGADTNNLRLCFATLLCIFSGMLVLILSAWFTVFIPEVRENPALFGFEVIAALMFFIVFFGGTVFFFAPCISGVIYFASRTVCGEKPRLISIFAPFTSKKLYFRSILLPLALLLRAAIMLLPLVGGILNLPFLYSSVNEMSLFEIIADSAFVLCLTALAFAVGAYISSYFFFVPYLVIKEKSGFFASFVASVKMARTRKKEITKQTLSASGYVILSVLSFMVLWVILAAPRMLVSYFVYCDKVAEQQNFE